MRKPVVASLILHAVVITLAWVGLPRLGSDRLAPPAAISVEVVTVDEVTAAPNMAPKARIEPKPEPAPEPTPEPVPQPAPKPVAEVEPKPKAEPEPKPPAPEPKMASQPAPEPPKAEPPPPEPAPKTQAELAPEPMPAPAAKPAPPPKPEPEPEVAARTSAPALVDRSPRETPQEAEDFASVAAAVAALASPESETAPQPPEPPEADARKPLPEPSETADLRDQIAEALARTPPTSHTLGSRVTIGEIDLVRRQIERCWNVPAGAREAADLVVHIRVQMNLDGTPRNAAILDGGRLGSDSFYRAAAESALRAVLNPRCHPFRLPPEKFEDWKTITLVFNPKEMLGT